MSDRCSTCGVTADELARPWGALLTHTQRIGKRVVQWTVCLRCELKERRAA